ncbi:MAG: cupin domain-containing protein [Deltaproteobacteria bacterium]
MSQKYTDEEIQNLAASYALGVLSEEEKAEFEALLKDEVAANAHLQYFKDIVNDISYNTEPLKEPEGLEKRLLGQIEKKKRVSEEQSGFLYVRADEGEWAEVVKGVKVKQLYEDPERKYATVLVKMDAGATFPDHVHTEAEECYVIEGDLHTGGKAFSKGDYIRAEAHSVHDSIYSENGCLLLVQSSEENEMLPAT